MKKIKGTIIRIHDPLTGQHLQELRRGLEYAQIYSLSFDYYGRWLAIACDSGTIHIFNLKLSVEELTKNQYKIYVMFIFDLEKRS